MWRYINHVDHAAQNLGQDDWFLVLCAVVAVGAFCMRGFGRRGY